MKKPIYIGFAYLTFLMTACGGTTTAVPTATLTEDLAVEDEASDVITSPPATCTAVSALAPSEEASLFPEVTSTDWARGPADAAVTIVEYGDFQ